MKDQILDILADIVDDDVESCTTLIDDGVLSSLDIIQLIGALNDEFDISIPATEIIPQNFNSLWTRWSPWSSVWRTNKGRWAAAQTCPGMQSPVPFFRKGRY